MTRLSKISIVLFLITFFIQIVVSNHMSIKTRELNDTQKKVVEVQNQISVINQEIFTSSSITGMEERALGNGFSYMAGVVKTVTKPTMASAL